MISYMVKEQFRLASDIYDGSKLLLFPLVIFSLSLIFLTQTSLNEMSENSLTLGLAIFSFITGIIVGSVNFSSGDVLKNLVGENSYLVYTSRTLPVSKRKILSFYLLSEFVFFAGLFFVPFYAVVLFFTDLAAFNYVLVALAPILGFLSAFLLSLTTGIFSKKTFLTYESDEFRPITERTILDLLRSGGGIFKVLATYAFLTILYLLLQNTYLEFSLVLASIFLGIVSVSVYNWINRFDSWQDYSHHPVAYKDVVKDKFVAFLTISIVLNSITLIAFYYFVGGLLLVALITNISVVIFLGGISAFILGLESNTKVYNFKIYSEYVFIILCGLVPLMVLALFIEDFYNIKSSLTVSYYTIIALISLIGLVGVKNLKKQFG